MRIIRDPKRLNPCVLVLGMFDGVHRGHQALLMRGDELAQEMVYPLAVCTFQPHPLHVLAPEKEPVMLTTLPEKAAVMQSFGVDGLCVGLCGDLKNGRTVHSLIKAMAKFKNTGARQSVAGGFYGGTGGGVRTGCDCVRF